MKKVIVRFIKNTIIELELKYAQNYVAVKELESKTDLSSKDKENIEAGKFNMGKAIEKLKWYKDLLKQESKLE